MNGTAALPRRSFGETTRPDVWWLQPLLVFLGLSTFIVYSTWAAFQGAHYFFGNYISPFIRRNFLVLLRTAGSGRNQIGGRLG